MTVTTCYAIPFSYVWGYLYNRSLTVCLAINVFRLGLEAMHQITSRRQYTLRINITDWNDEVRYAEYPLFSIGDEDSQYRLMVYGFQGTAGDGLSEYHNGARFSTVDRDNDRSFFEHCAVVHQGPWWYDRCDDANLNGRYRGDLTYADGEVDIGIEWKAWRDRYPFKASSMSIKPTYDDDF